MRQHPIPSCLWEAKSQAQGWGQAVQSSLLSPDPGQWWEGPAWQQASQALPSQPPPSAYPPEVRSPVARTGGGGGGLRELSNSMG